MKVGDLGKFSHDPQQSGELRLENSWLGMNEHAYEKKITYHTHAVFSVN